MPLEREEIIVKADNEVNTSNTPLDPLTQLNKARQLFFIFILIGFVIITGPSLFNFSNFYGIPASLAVCLYASMAYKRKSNFMEQEVVADAIYYLGFLYTFIALLIGFLSSIGNVAAINIIELIGIALMTTVVGLAIRIYLVHFQRIDTNEEEDIRQSVVQSMGLLNREINDSIQQIKKLREKSITNLTGTIDDINNSINSSLEDFQNGLEEQLSDVRNVVKEQMNTNLTDQIDNINHISSESVQHLSNVSRDLASRINDIDIPQDLVTSRINDALENFRNESYLLSNEVQEVTRLINVEKDNIIEANNQLESLVSNIGTIELNFSSLNDAANNVGDLNISLESLNETLNNLDQAFDSHSSEFTKNIGEASVSFVEVRDSIKDMSKEIQSTIDGLNNYLEKLMRD